MATKGDVLPTTQYDCLNSGMNIGMIGLSLYHYPKAQLVLHARLFIKHHVHKILKIYNCPSVIEPLIILSEKLKGFHEMAGSVSKAS